MNTVRMMAVVCVCFSYVGMQGMDHDNPKTGQQSQNVVNVEKGRKIVSRVNKASWLAMTLGGGGFAGQKFLNKYKVPCPPKKFSLAMLLAGTVTTSVVGLSNVRNNPNVLKQIGRMFDSSDEDYQYSPSQVHKGW